MVDKKALLYSIPSEGDKELLYKVGRKMAGRSMCILPKCDVDEGPGVAPELDYFASAKASLYHSFADLYLGYDFASVDGAIEEIGYELAEVVVPMRRLYRSRERLQLVRIEGHSGTNE